MSETYSPQAAAEQARDSFRKAAKQFESFKLDTTVPESVRALAEKTVNQSREAYERGKDALEEAIDALERSFDAAGQGATAFNRKLIDLAQRQEPRRDRRASVGFHPPAVRRLRQSGGRDQSVDHQNRRRYQRAAQEPDVAFLRDAAQDFVTLLHSRPVAS
jgi:uncharacterized protein (UPF0147 family)